MSDAWDAMGFTVDHDSLVCTQFGHIILRYIMILKASFKIQRQRFLLARPVFIDNAAILQSQ